jgi:hypothetical protein
MRITGIVELAQMKGQIAKKCNIQFQGKPPGT